MPLLPPFPPADSTLPPGPHWKKLYRQQEYWVGDVRVGSVHLPPREGRVLVDEWHQWSFYLATEWEDRSGRARSIGTAKKKVERLYAAWAKVNGPSSNGATEA